MPGEKRPLVTDKNPTQEVFDDKNFKLKGLQIKGIANDIFTMHTDISH